ncbi:putative aminoacyltransferase, E1 ubiquitin-activating enzyme [Lupinus albus]|uniref:RBR-type E3 ubiquitin transferase n=1 Tax=Lupinus albus TaxID=3870 RepID=A0A6A4R4I5_LUPAL|nr:putative aminoacyltransferase, E1 ubiquitin-activating enzyme [Lupinus albus]
MDSSDDMHDANDIDSLDDDFYSDDAPINYYSDYDDEADDDYFDDADDADRIHARTPEQNFTILKESDIQQRQDEDISRVATVLSISKVSASILLRHYNWSVSKVHDAWFADEVRVRKAVGLLEQPVVQYPNDEELKCGICFENYPRAKIQMASCGHPYCISCWAGYIGTSINDGPGCLMLRCPDPTCGAAVGQDMIDLIPSDDDKHKYNHYLLRSYIEDNKKVCNSSGICTSLFTAS